MEFKCCVCCKEFATIDITIKHIKNIHRIQNNSKDLQCIVKNSRCCTFTTKRFDTLKKHTTKCADLNDISSIEETVISIVMNLIFFFQNHNKCIVLQISNLNLNDHQNFQSCNYSASDLIEKVYLIYFEKITQSLILNHHIVHFRHRPLILKSLQQLKRLRTLITKMSIFNTKSHVSLMKSIQNQLKHSCLK